MDNKGDYNGKCNLSRCTTGKPASWYNHGSLKYYCPECAEMLSSDVVNAREAQKLFGHALCTEGEHIERITTMEMLDEPIVLKNHYPVSYFEPQKENRAARRAKERANRKKK